MMFFHQHSRFLPATLLMLLAGCTDPREDFGKTYYLDGAGNWGFGVAEVPAGLKDAGYEGHVEVYVWTSSFMPAIDQVNAPANRLRAAVLSGKIADYARRHPQQAINVIALSAGTGIAVWAVEALPEGIMVDNLVLLGSSLSSGYDMRRALRHIRNRVTVFYSPKDEVLSSAVRVLGTVDGTHEDSAGLVGLRPRSGPSSKIVNVRWSPQYRQYGWTGAHTDATNRRFIRHVVAPILMGKPSPGGGPGMGGWPRTRSTAAGLPAAPHTTDVQHGDMARAHGDSGALTW